ncbi:MAG: hypothetical protein U0840_07265 [Gemmataceae bacterium]
MPMDDPDCHPTVILRLLTVSLIAGGLTVNLRLLTVSLITRSLRATNGAPPQ